MSGDPQGVVESSGVVCAPVGSELGFGISEASGIAPGSVPTRLCLSVCGIHKHLARMREQRRAAGPELSLDLRRRRFLVASRTPVRFGSPTVGAPATIISWLLHSGSSELPFGVSSRG